MAMPGSGHKRHDGEQPHRRRRFPRPLPRPARSPSGGSAPRATPPRSASERLGFPGRRDEAWKYTNLRPLAEAAFHEPLSVVEDSSYLLSAPRIAETRLVFIDGRFRQDLSDAVPSGFTPFAAHPEFGTLARPDRDPMAALNTMLAEDGARLDHTRRYRRRRAIQLAAISSGGTAVPTASHPRHVIHLGRNARLTLIETCAGEGAYLHNPVTEITLAEGAELQHIRLQQEDGAAFHLATIYAEAEQAATITASPSPWAAVSSAPSFTQISPDRTPPSISPPPSFCAAASTPTSPPSCVTRRRAARRARR